MGIVIQCGCMHVATWLAWRVGEDQTRRTHSTKHTTVCQTLVADDAVHKTPQKGVRNIYMVPGMVPENHFLVSQCTKRPGPLSTEIPHHTI